MRRIAAIFFSLVLIIVPGAASAAAEEWLAAKATAQVRYTVDKKTWLPLRNGMTVPNQAWISTGPRGRLQLVRGKESISFQPNTLAAIFTRGGDRNRKTEVVQQVGEISLEIEKRDQPHTTVQTPFLAAVVKGTRFTVEVSKTEASVGVDRGVVQVTSFRSGERSDLTAGQGARVDQSGMTVAGLSGSPEITRVAPSTAPVPAVGATTTSDDGAAATNTGASSQNTNKASDSRDRSSDGNGNGNGRGRDSGDDGDSDSSGGNGNAGGNGKSEGKDKNKGGGNGKGQAKGHDKGDDDEDDSDD